MRARLTFSRDTPARYSHCSSYSRPSAPPDQNIRYESTRRAGRHGAFRGSVRRAAGLGSTGTRARSASPACGPRARRSGSFARVLDLVMEDGLVRLVLHEIVAELERHFDRVIGVVVTEDARAAEQ